MSITKEGKTDCGKACGELESTGDLQSEAAKWKRTKQNEVELFK